ncbi:MAG TPA: hypothetical protein VL225_02715 [Vicinamibacterales bacterium]|nr:hypothetical protein [Vicinamibacterales bacterium]
MRFAIQSLMLALAVTVPASAQDNYEIQVYGAELVPPGATMVELHSNFAASGQRLTVDGVKPTNHAVHETLEVTHGFTDWFECGFYLFTSGRAGDGVDLVGSHVRPRVSVPARYHLPVGLSLSQEIGYQRRSFADATATYELRPIVDQQLGRLYWTFNPTLERALNGDVSGRRFEFTPNAMVTYDLTKRLSAGLEYYGGFGPVGNLEPWRSGGQQLFPAINIDFGPDWEFNAAVGFGLTDSAEPLLMKVIVGRRFGLHAARTPPAP